MNGTECHTWFPIVLSKFLLVSSLLIILTCPPQNSSQHLLFKDVLPPANKMSKSYIHIETIASIMVFIYQKQVSIEDILAP